MPLKVNAPLPSLEGITHWINGSVSDHDLLGHPVLIDFWAVSCPFCLHNMPRLQEWRELYSSLGLKIITVHRPRCAADYDRALVGAAIAEHRIIDPCALDHEGILAARFQATAVWPYYFLFDAQGTMRSRAAGYAGLKLLENALQRSLVPSSNPVGL